MICTFRMLTYSPLSPGQHPNGALCFLAAALAALRHRVLGPLWTRAAKNIYSGYLCGRHDIGYVLRLLTAAVSVSTRKLTQVVDAASDCPPQSALSLTLPLSAAKVMFWLRVINNNCRH